MIFKLILVTLTSGCMFYFLIVTRNHTLQRLFILFFFGTGLFFILKPEVTSWLANSVGIGRGADLIFYLSILFLFFICFNFYLRLESYDQRLTQITRTLALQNPVKEENRINSRN